MVCHQWWGVSAGEVDRTVLHHWSMESTEGKIGFSMQNWWLRSPSQWGIRTTGVVVWLEKQQHDRFMALSIRESTGVILHRSNQSVFNVHRLRSARTFLKVICVLELQVRRCLRYMIVMQARTGRPVTQVGLYGRAAEGWCILNGVTRAARVAWFSGNRPGSASQRGEWWCQAWLGPWTVRRSRRRLIYRLVLDLGSQSWPL